MDKLTGNYRNPLIIRIFAAMRYEERARKKTRLMGGVHSGCALAAFKPRRHPAVILQRAPDAMSFVLPGKIGVRLYGAEPVWEEHGDAAEAHAQDRARTPAMYSALRGSWGTSKARFISSSTVGLI